MSTVPQNPHPVPPTSTPHLLNNTVVESFLSYLAPLQSDHRTLASPMARDMARLPPMRGTPPGRCITNWPAGVGVWACAVGRWPFSYR